MLSPSSFCTLVKVPHSWRTRPLGFSAMGSGVRAAPKTAAVIAAPVRAKRRWRGFMAVLPFKYQRRVAAGGPLSHACVKRQPSFVEVNRLLDGLRHALLAGHDLLEQGLGIGHWDIERRDAN